jgi:hypothetical protein
VAWVMLILAGLFEVVWAFYLKQSDGFTTPRAHCDHTGGHVRQLWLAFPLHESAAARHRLYDLDWHRGGGRHSLSELRCLERRPAPCASSRPRLSSQVSFW